MKELDKKISELFMSMIKSWDKIDKLQDGEIFFNNHLSIYARKKDEKEDSNRENIPLKLDENTFSNYLPWFNTIKPDTDKILFFINTPYRQYNVPEHSWKEYAEVLEIIDDSLHKFEEKKLKEYLDYYNDGKVDNRKNG